MVVQIHITAYKKFATQYKLFMVNYKSDVCEALKLKNHPLYKFFLYKSNTTQSNLLDPCPMQVSSISNPFRCS